MIKIKCPHCNREYIPSEIFYPDKYFGNPKIVIRDELGAITDITGADMDLVESYECDGCGFSFKVKLVPTIEMLKCDQFDEWTSIKLK